MGGGGHKAHRWRRLARSVLVQEEEEEGWLSQKAGWAGWLLGQKLKEKSFRNKNWIFEYTKALEICRRRFMRNFDNGIFPKFFWAFQGF
jgi:hypothetical protein